MLKKLIALFICILYSMTCWGDSILSRMTLEEKVGQLLIPDFHGEIANEDARILIQEISVGGIVYYNSTNGLNSPEQIKKLSKSLQKLTRSNRLSIPLFIAVDQEGGVVTRLKNGFSFFPGNKTFGDTGNCDLARIVALTMGREMRSVGINMNFAPVVDVNINPSNPIIGSRSFSSNPKTVLAFGAKALQGYRKAHVIATLKHFPGHGDVEVDSHKDLPTIHKSMKELEAVELLPFAGLATHADVIMTAHLLVPALDPEKCSTLSEKTLTYLRKKIGFKGVIISDSLVMQGVLKQCSTIDEAVIQAFIAGCDLLLLGGGKLSGEDIRRIHSSLIEAIKSGRISEERLNESLVRILKLKKRYLKNRA